VFAVRHQVVMPGDVRNQFLTQNQGRADAAASGLSGQYFNAGNNLQNSIVNSGKAVSSGLTTAGDITASSMLGQAGVQGKAIGDIGAIIADEIKNKQKRPSNYNDVAQGV
jgi:hypothetical protein